LPDFTGLETWNKLPWSALIAISLFDLIPRRNPRLGGEAKAQTYDIACLRQLEWHVDIRYVDVSLEEWVDREMKFWFFLTPAILYVSLGASGQDWPHCQSDGAG
jgi:hypothetical protein